MCISEQSGNLDCRKNVLSLKMKQCSEEDACRKMPLPTLPSWIQEILQLNHKKDLFTPMEASTSLHWFLHFTGQSEEREQEVLSYTLLSRVKAFLFAVAVLLKEACSYSHWIQISTSLLLIKNRLNNNNRYKGQEGVFGLFYMPLNKTRPTQLGKEVKVWAMYYSLKVKYMEPYEGKPQTLSTLEETSPRASHVFQCISALNWTVLIFALVSHLK